MEAGTVVRYVGEDRDVPNGVEPLLKAFDLVEGPDGIIWTVGRQSDDTVELHHRLAGCCYESQSVVRKWPRKGRLGTSPRAQEVRQYIASLPSTSTLAAIPSRESSDPESISARVFNVLAASMKVPFTDVGIAIMKNYLRVPFEGLPLQAQCAAESGSGIAASPVSWKRQPTACSALGKPLPRPHRRHQTTSWDPDMPLPDAEPGRYGWLP